MTGEARQVGHESPGDALLLNGVPGVGHRSGERRIPLGVDGEACQGPAISPGHCATGRRVGAPLAHRQAAEQAPPP